MQVKHERNSSLELLKIFAVIMIVFSHAIPNSGERAIGYIDLAVATTSMQQLIMVILKYLGQVGNVIFIVASAWFLLDSKKAKIQKAIDIVLDSFFISVIFLPVFIALGYPLPANEIIKNLIPITMNNNWYVGCYLIFYLIHPALNIVVHSMKKEKLLATNLVLLVFYCGVNLLIHDRYYYTQLVGFICIYFMVAYMKYYLPNFICSKKRNIRLLIVSSCCFFGLIFGTNYLGLRIEALANSVVQWSIIVNPFIILMVLPLFNLVNARQFYNCGINYISSLSLLVYMIHADRLVMDYAKMDFFAWLYKEFSYSYVLLWVLLVGCILLVGGVVLSILYKETLQKLLRKVCNWTQPTLKKTTRFVLEKIMEIT